MKNVDYQLRQFIEVAKHKSLSDAAVTLNVTQSALSKQLREIESLVGHPVFRRHGRGVELTEQGDALRRAAQMAYQLIDTTISKIRAEQPFSRRALRIATAHHIAGFVEDEVLERLFNHRPDINVSMTEGSVTDVFRLVESGTVDIGFVEAAAGLPRTLKATDIHWIGHRTSRAEIQPDTVDLSNTEAHDPSDLLPSGSPDFDVNMAAAAELTDERTFQPNEDPADGSRNLLAITRKNDTQVARLLSSLTETR
jgi:DNA-binding transcriptional LysR family regulator